MALPRCEYSGDTRDVATVNGGVTRPLARGLLRSQSMRNASIARLHSDIAPRPIDDLHATTRVFATQLVTRATGALEIAARDRPKDDPARRLALQAGRWLSALDDGDDKALCRAAMATREAFSSLLVSARLGSPEDRALCAAVGRLAAAIELADRACVMAGLLRES
jgi:hypothetical protein